MKCANCGNDDKRILWDDGDTIYCSNCCHRTLKETGEDDLVECPCCGYERDRTALYCFNCGHAWGAKISGREKYEIRKILQEEFGYKND